MQLGDGIALAAFLVAVVSATYTWRVRQQTRAESYRVALYDRELTVSGGGGSYVRAAHSLLLADPSAAEQTLEAIVQRLTEMARASPFLPPGIVRAATVLAERRSSSRRERTDGVWRETRRGMGPVYACGGKRARSGCMTRFVPHIFAPGQGPMRPTPSATTQTLSTALRRPPRRSRRRP